MLKLKQGVALVAVGSLAFVAGRMLPIGDAAIAAQPAKDTKTTQPAKDKPTAAQPGADMPMAKPGAEHKVLEVFVGEFQGSGNMWMDPTGPAMPFSGKVTRKWDLDNWFVSEEVLGDPSPAGQPAYKALGIMGYNQIEKRYESGWADNMLGVIGTNTGTYDAAKKTFTFTGECLDPMTKKRTTTRTTIDVSNPGTEIMTGYSKDATGKEFKSFEGTFTRVKK